MTNAFTVDVEDYFHVTAFSAAVDVGSWTGRESRVERNTHVILEMLSQRNVRGTFFILGWVAERYPNLVREIAAGGHEIASHGMSHQLIYRQGSERFREETRRSKKTIEDLAQQPVIGYRAATYSITKRSLWALDILVEEGFCYDSSIFPIHHDRYGIPNAPLDPCRLVLDSGATIVEFPISVWRSGIAVIPVAGGGYFRMLPYGVTRWGLQRLNAKGRPFVFYIHPWEVDPQQPRVSGVSLLSRFRHYTNLDRCRTRLETLLNEFSFVPMNEVLQQEGLLEWDSKSVLPDKPKEIRTVKVSDFVLPHVGGEG